jgi:hypothetical protein
MSTAPRVADIDLREVAECFGRVDVMVLSLLLLSQDAIQVLGECFGGVAGEN